MPSFPRRRESSKKITLRSGQQPDIEPLRGDFFINWIPACAGMTVAIESLCAFTSTAIWQAKQILVPSI